MTNLGFPSRLIAAGEEPLGDRVNVYFKMATLRNIVDALPPDEKDFIKESPLGKLLDLLNKPSWSASFGIFLLSRQLNLAKSNKIWVVYARTPVQFSLREFKHVTGFPCGKFSSVRKKKKKGTAGTLFGVEEDVSVERVISILNKKSNSHDFEVGEQDRRLRLACLAIVDGFLFPTLHYSKISKNHAELFANLDEFLSYPWCQLSFVMMITSIKERDVQQLATTCVSVQGLLYVLQLVVVQAVSEIQDGPMPVTGGGSDSDEEAAIDLHPKQVFSTWECERNR